MNGHIESVDSESFSELVELARLQIEREIEARGWQFDVNQVTLLRSPEPHDLDQDGRDESWHRAWSGATSPARRP